MSRERIYLDHNARSALRAEARAAMIAALDHDGNASSVHAEGREARRLVEDAREQVAALVGAEPREIVFTSGATEANNVALGQGWGTIALAGIEHESVLVPAKASGAKTVELPVGGNGVVGLANLDGGDLSEGNVSEGNAREGASGGSVLGGSVLGGPVLLTLQLANNETGVCQDVAGAAEFCRAQGWAMHTDAVQACGRIDVDFAALRVDLMSLSSHKIGGPMGVGALVVRDGFELSALITGGGQERRRRAGTENVAAIAGFGAAARVALAQRRGEAERLAGLRDRAQAAMVEIGAVVIGGGVDRLANTLCVAFPGHLAETTVIKLDLAGVSISAGSACSSGKVGASHVLSAMGLPPDVARSAVRISLGWNTSETSLEQFLSRFERLFASQGRAVA